MAPRTSSGPLPPLVTDGRVHVIVLYIPEWVPGAGFKKTARRWRATLAETVERPMSFVRRQMAERHNAPSYVSALYDKAGQDITEHEEDVIKYTAVALYTGGADTVSVSQPQPSPTSMARKSSLLTPPSPLPFSPLRPICSHT